VSEADTTASSQALAEEPRVGATGSDEQIAVGGSAADAASSEAADAAPLDVGDVAADAALIDVGDIAADYIEGLLDICDLDGDIEIEEAGGRTTLVVTAETGTRLDLLSGPETVTALQELTRLAVQARTGDFARLTLDIGGSRDTRTRELRDLVDGAAQRLAAGEERIPLPPMSSYERKVVHDLAAERGLTSASEGEGSARHTVLTRA
jgi:spoIIIJ-associated protein